VADGEDGEAERGAALEGPDEGLDAPDCAWAAPTTAASISPATEVASSLDMDVSRGRSASKIPSIVNGIIIEWFLLPSPPAQALCGVLQAVFAAFRTQGCVRRPGFCPGATL
jgi:hypothetical protein